MIAKMVFVAALLASTAAVAQEADKDAAPEQIAAAKAIADRIIAAAGAEGIFVNTTDGVLAEVTHVPSGMVCVFDGGPEDRISIFPVQGGDIPHGEDVGCVSRDEAVDIDITLYATRYRPLPSEEMILATARRAIENRWPDAKVYDGDLTRMNFEGQSPALLAAYRVRLEGEDKLTMALVSHRDGWGFKARATGPFEDAMVVSLYTGVVFEGALADREDEATRNR
ncbi:hypothetical protein [Brevundimonas sp.]|uniref:hypothetical protein n=1 Tax=Brevundimonas sp. TaxID=1871086 RepID=UPI002D271397|nr:hypothetical protein [Brevundimonas sp.]HYC74452.1 hypothetical protein [Brevundimonas sp.]